jgi:hypothetical protein
MSSTSGALLIYSSLTYLHSLMACCNIPNTKHLVYAGLNKLCVLSLNIDMNFANPNCYYCLILPGPPDSQAAHMNRHCFQNDKKGRKPWR